MRINARHAKLILLGLTASVGGGCALPEMSSVNPTYPCVGGPAAKVGPFSMQIINAEWQTETPRPGTENIPPAQKAAMGSAMSSKASYGFLVLSVRIVNGGNAPYAWSLPPNYIPEYYLINAQGQRLGFSLENSSIVMKTQSVNLNPGLPMESTIVFDVPAGAYTFELDRVELAASGRIRKPYHSCTVN